MRKRQMDMRVAALCAVLIVLFGCTSVGPQRLEQDRFNYNAAISDSWRVQSLLNIVKLRYLDWPVFLEVEQIVAQYTWKHVGTAKGIFRLSEYDQGEFGYVGEYSERPAILFKPLQGKEYMQTMLTPVPLGALLGLVTTGWPVDRMLETMAHSINGRRNTQVEQNIQLNPAPAFARLLGVLRAFQSRDALIISISQRKKAKSGEEVIGTHLEFRVDLVDDKTRNELTEIKRLFGLNPETDRYKVIWGPIPPDDLTLSIETRSVLQLMVALSAGVEVPESDIREGRVVRLPPPKKENTLGLTPLMRIRSGASAPSDAYASCGYRGLEFWIDDTDVNSKRSFAYLTMFLTLGDVDDKGGTPLVITTN